MIWHGSVNLWNARIIANSTLRLCVVSVSSPCTNKSFTSPFCLVNTKAAPYFPSRTNGPVTLVSM